ncbi:hypothetical protein [Roseinatronobacter sp. S2]|uniref:hypothetical protein n=1 Tax=Roseinatronobacter sp. S2 TaxID=3035471 RepID=UPI00241066D0|nr:hypothetical protein [Roseinatronobacter sp. S2]WFE76960.1 hypothetical protein P8S53_18120 [Roseinatronobacter sp. S2]
MTTFKKHALIVAIFVAATTPAISEASHAGQLTWNSGSASVSEALCGFSGDDFMLVPRSEGVRLRLGFKGAGTLDSIDFSDLSSVELSFTDAHILSGQRYARYKSLGEMGEIDAGPEGATGTLTLRPGSAEALDARPDGMQITYSFDCTGEIF